MRRVSDVLRDIKHRRPSGGPVDIYIVIDDEQDDEPLVHRASMSKEMLARSDNPGVARTVLENGLLAAIKRWRNGDVGK